MTTQSYFGTLVIRTCPTCGLRYGLDEDFDRLNGERSRTWYCPAGHKIYFGTSKLDEAEQRAKRLESDRDYWQREEKREREARVAAEHRERAQKAAKTRIKNRVAKGVCPCCNRSFQNLRRHMTDKHPSFASGDAKTTPEGV